MNETAIANYIRETFADVTTIVADGNTFFFVDPDQKFTFATLVTNDLYDKFSDLDRPSVFRLNIGVGKETFRSLFGDQPFDEQEYDYTALDQFVPHPFYGRQYWISMLNPSDETFETRVKPYLAEAYERDVRKYAKRAAKA